MVRSVLIFLLVVGWSATTALAAPAARQRVVLADPDPELRHAMEQALAPWHLEIVIEGPSPTDTAMAQERADADTARFVVWRQGDELVVYDRELGFTEQRSCQAGVLDPPAAAAAALTIKTMMRLPPPPPPPSEAVPPASPEGPVGSSFEVRLQAAIATRITHGNDTRITARFGGAAEIRPWAGSGWRFGVAGDGGTATAVSQASFKGTWSEWTAFGLVSWTYLRGAWEFEPHAGAGIRRSALAGSETTVVRNETATLPSARGGLWVRGRVSRWTFGAALDVDGSFGTPTYSKTGAPAEIFQVPGVGAELGAVVAVDL